MYLLDTNVISELRKSKSPRINKNVAHWAKSVSSSILFLSAITLLELEIGVLLIERRDSSQGILLRSWIDSHILPVFSERILPLDTAVAKQCAKLHVPDRKSDRDAMIAATALVHGMTIVTRNIVDYKNINVELLNPWEFA
ncbi:MAG TPA: type II toxin-antitoxin system VapC family toxin [Gammaproteobacteria bacterium]|jgi:predicted nucleic acid-binding protein|nr:type II toxin-antitoxin system VapC family toxin [Gammaproteobacteria bacterium]